MVTAVDQEEKVIDLIRKLLNMTTAAGCTEAEAANAAAKADELMQKFQLTLGSVRERGGAALIVLRKVELGGSESWRGWLLDYLARYSFCKAWGNWGHGQVIGEDHNIDIMMAVFEFLAGQFPRLCSVAYTKAVASGEFDQPKPEWDQYFYWGLVSAVNTRLREQYETFRTASPEAMALVVDNSADLDAKYNELHPPIEPQPQKTALEQFEADLEYNLRWGNQSRRRSQREDSPETIRQRYAAQQSGRAAGASVMLNQQVKA